MHEFDKWFKKHTGAAAYDDNYHEEAKLAWNAAVAACMQKLNDNKRFLAAVTLRHLTTKIEPKTTQDTTNKEIL